MVAQPFPHHHSLEIHYSQFRDWQTFSVKSQIVNILCFVDHTDSVVSNKTLFTKTGWGAKCDPGAVVCLGPLQNMEAARAGLLRLRCLCHPAAWEWGLSNLDLWGRQKSPKEARLLCRAERGEKEGKEQALAWKVNFQLRRSQEALHGALDSRG
jgi:hypothetical protein